mgnify:FL=1|jgi:hypothetical protein
MNQFDLVESIQSMISSANQENPTAFKSAFEKAVLDKVGDALTAKKMEMGKAMFPENQPEEETEVEKSNEND